VNGNNAGPSTQATLAQKCKLRFKKESTISSKQNCYMANFISLKPNIYQKFSSTSEDKVSVVVTLIFINQNFYGHKLNYM
jgi:hypothetical protein